MSCRTPSTLEMDLMAAAVPAEVAPKGVNVVLLSDALRAAYRAVGPWDQEEEPLSFALPADAQFIATEVDGAVSVHVGVDNSGFSLCGDRGALRSLANMILCSLDNTCPKCQQKPSAFMDEKGNIRAASTVARYPTLAEFYTIPLYLHVPQD